MWYFIRRYRHGMWTIRRWLPLILIPAIVYVVYTASTPDRFSVSQVISVQFTSPVSLSRTPVDILLMKDITSDPVKLFLDDFALIDLSKQLAKSPHLRKTNLAIGDIQALLETCMTIEPIHEGKVQLVYYGSDLELGKTLVQFYTQRLILRSQEGIARSMRKARMNGSFATLQSASISQAEPSDVFQTARTDGELQVKQYKALWRSDRLPMFINLVILSFLVWAVCAGLVAWMDPAFHSERQIARYMDMPILGCIPNLDNLMGRMTPKS